MRFARQSFDPPPDSGTPLPPGPPPGRTLVVWWVTGGLMLIAIVAVLVVVLTRGSDDSAVESTLAASTTATPLQPTDAPPSSADTAPSPTDPPDLQPPGTAQPEVTTPPVQPMVIAGLAASITDGTLTVTWNDPGDESGFLLDIQPGGPRTLPANVTAVDIEPVECGIAFAITLTANDAAGNPAASAQTTARGSECAQAPIPPSNLQAELIPGPPEDMVRIQWDDGWGETGYAMSVELAMPGAGEPWTNTQELDENTTEYTTILPCDGRLEAVLEAIHPDGSRFGQLTLSIDGPHCDPWDVIGDTEHVEGAPVAATGIATAAVDCPQGDVVGGGYTVGPFQIPDGGDRPFVLGNRPTASGWEVRVAVPPGQQLTIAAVALCAPGARTQVMEAETQVAGGGTVEVACPAGMTMTGGGWWADPFLDVIGNSPNTNGWRVQAYGDTIGETGRLSAYALCLSDNRLQTQPTSAVFMIPEGASQRIVTPACPAGSMLSGGGFDINQMAASASMPALSEPGAVRDDIWIAVAVNPDNGGNAMQARAYGVCLVNP